METTQRIETEGKVAKLVEKFGFSGGLDMTISYPTTEGIRTMAVHVAGGKQGLTQADVVEEVTSLIDGEIFGAGAAAVAIDCRGGKPIDAEHVSSLKHPLHEVFAALQALQGRAH